MVVNQWHVIQAEQPSGFIDEWHLKLLLENQCSCYIKQAGAEPYQTVARWLRADFCLRLQRFRSWVAPNLRWPNSPVCELRAQSCTAQNRSPEVDTSKSHIAGTGSEYQRKAGTLLEPACCSYLPSATGTAVTRAAAWGLNTGVGFLFFLFQACLGHSTPLAGMYKLQGAHFFPSEQSRDWGMDAAPAQMQHCQLHNCITSQRGSLPTPGLRGADLEETEGKVQPPCPLWWVLIWLDGHSAPPTPDPYSCHIPRSLFSLARNMSKGSCEAALEADSPRVHPCLRLKRRENIFKKDQTEPFYSGRLLRVATAPCFPPECCSIQLSSLSLPTLRPAEVIGSFTTPDLAGKRPAAKWEASVTE